LYNKKKITGRDKKGTLILYYRGGGVKNIFRIIDFKKYI
jgi:ribosomal protein L2